MQTATNPQTGEQVIFVDGAWKPVERTATNKAGAKAYLTGGRWIVGDVPQAEEPGILDDLKRQTGLTARAGAEGLAGTVGIFADPINRVLGLKPLTEGVSNLLTAAGVPTPESDQEKFVGSVAKGMAGAGGFAGAARAIPQVVGAAPALINNIFAAAPGAQIAQAGIGAGASEAVKQGGGNEWEQLLAGAVAPVAASGAVSGVKMAARGGRELVRPLTTPGSEQIAADVLGRVTQDKTTALANLDRYLQLKAQQAAGGPQVGAPGFSPTAAMVAGDPGIVGASRVVERGPANPLFAQIGAKNNAALLDDLARLRASQQQIESYIARRESLTTPLREQAFANSKGPVDFNVVADKVAELAATPAGGRVESDKALNWLVNRLEWYASRDRTDPANAYGLYQDIGALVAGKVADDKGAPIRLAGGLANEVKKVLGQQIEAAAPGFQKYLETYKRLSKPIERLQVIHDRLGEDLARVTNAGVMGTGDEARYALSQAKVKNALAALRSDLPVKNGLPLAPYQSDILERVLGNLNAQNFASTFGRPPGSDTYQNMATANFLRGVLGETLAQSGLAKSVSTPVNLLYRPLEERINNLVVEAMTDPEKMRNLLLMARTSRQSPTLLNALQDVGGGAGLGALGALVAQ